MKHRFVRRVSALALAGCLLAGSSLPAFAASTAKEEVIYANLTASGAVTGVYAVNSFSVQAGDTVADHGSYTAVRNMTTSDAVSRAAIRSRCMWPRTASSIMRAPWTPPRPCRGW